MLPRSREEMLAALMGPLPQVALAASPATLTPRQCALEQLMGPLPRVCDLVWINAYGGEDEPSEPQVALAASPAEDREPVDASSWLFPWAP